MANFAVVLVHGPGWDLSRGIREQQGWTQHAEFMDGLVADRLILLGGPVGDGQQTLHVVEADDESTVRTRLAEDPWARHGLLEVGSVQPWALWLDFRNTRSTGDLACSSGYPLTGNSGIGSATDIASGSDS